MDEWKEVWDLYDRNPKNGILNRETVKHCIRGTGRLYTEPELNNLLGEDSDISYDHYITVMNNPYIPPSCTVIDACKAVDGKEKGVLSDTQITQSM